MMYSLVKNKHTKIEFILIACVVLAFTAPPLQLGKPFYITSIILGILWLILSFSKNSEWYLRPNRVILLIYFNIPWMIYILVISDNYDFIEWHYSLFMFYLMIFVGNYYYKYNKKYLVNYLWIVLATFPLWCILSIKELSINPYALRSIKSQYDSYAAYYAVGVGSYHTVYSSVIICIICVYLLLNGNIKSIYKKTILYTAVSATCLLVLYSGYTIANLALFTSLLYLVVFYKIDKNCHRFALISTVAVSIIFLWKLLFENLLSFVELVASGTPYQMKVVAIKNTFLNLSINDAAASVRIDAYKVSLDSFFEFPFFGSVFSEQVKYGQHSTILDIYALYGFLVGSFNTIILFSAPFVFVGFKGKRGNLAIVILWANFIILTFNNITYTYAVALLVMLPAACCLDCEN